MAEVRESTLSVVAEAAPLDQAFEAALIVVAEEYVAAPNVKVRESSLIAVAEGTALVRAFESTLIVVANSASGPTPPVSTGGQVIGARCGCCSHYSLPPAER